MNKTDSYYIIKVLEERLIFLSKVELDSDSAWQRGYHLGKIDEIKLCINIINNLHSNKELYEE